MSTSIRFALLTVAFAVMPVAVFAQQFDRRIDELFSELDRADSPGAAVLIVDDGKVVYRRGFGQANLEHGIAITPSTVFDVASVSKQFTGMSIAMLIEQDRISLEDDIRTYLPDLPDFGQTITIDHLVHHSSGIRDWPGTLAVAGRHDGDVISFEQILTMARNQQDLNFSPGTEYSYSNTGYNILAALVEKVSGQSFREWTNSKIFKPLGMTNTHFQDDHTQIVKNRARGYQTLEDEYWNVPNGLTAVGSSSLFSTVDDLAKWVMNFDYGRVGGKSVIERMRQRGELQNKEQISYAFGQNSVSYRGLDFWIHTGSWAGFRSVILRFPEKRFGVIILSNNGSYAPRAAAFNVVDVCLDDILESRSQDSDVVENSSVTVSADLLEEYIGVYRLGPGRLVTITREGDALMAQATAEDRFPMQAVSQQEFFVTAYGASMTFGRNIEEAVDHLTYRGNSAPRVAIVANSEIDLNDYVGHFYSEELDTSYRLSVRENSLVANHWRNGDIELRPILSDEFRGDQWFVPAVEFDRDSDGDVVGFRINQLRSKNIRFVREGGGD